MSVSVLRRRFTVDEYRRMAEAGIFSEGDRVELIEGEIVEMTPIGRRHFSCVTTLTHLLVSGVGDQALVSIQNSFRLSGRSEPEPDIAVLRRNSAHIANAEYRPRVERACRAHGYESPVLCTPDELMGEGTSRE